MITTKNNTLTFEFPINTNKAYENPEALHLELLLSFQNAKNTFYALNRVCADINTYSQLEELFKAIPDETLAICGYQKKNKITFERLLENLELLRNEERYTLAVSTNFDNLPNTEGLEFLKPLAA